MKKECLYACFLMLSTFVYGQKEISIKTELKRLFDIQQLPAYIDGSHVSEKSSYDTTGKNDDGFSGRYSFVRKNPDGTLVIFEAKGKGVINRMWLPVPIDDTLDFYFDGKEKPSFSVKFSDLFSGKVFPFVYPLCGNQLGGYYCYMPIPFENGCKIVLKNKVTHFYQIQYRSYPDSYSVKTFDPNLGDDEKAELKKIAAFWTAENKTIKDFYSGNVTVVNTNAVVKPGQTVSLLNLNQGGRIVGIEIDPASAFTGLNKQVDFKVTWDSEKNPAIYAPLADFFGYAFGSTSMQSLLLGSKGGKNYCYFPMPFDKSAKIELTYRIPSGNTGLESKSIHAKIYYTTKKRNPVTEGKFYAYWTNDLRPAEGKPHVFLNATGKGHYVGTLLQAQGLKPGMTKFFEGDDSTSTDGVTRIHGTGSEDYFNGGWYALLDRWDTKMSLPLHGALDYSLPFCRTGGYRLYLNDKLSFNKNIFQSIEHGPEGNKEPVDYISLGLYYSDTSPESITKPINLLSKVYIPDTLIMYPQLMRFTVSGSVAINIVNETCTFTSLNDSRVNISLAELPAGSYKIYADIETDIWGAEISMWQRQTQIGDWLSTYSPRNETKKHVYLCDVTLDELKNSVTIVFKTTGDNDQLMLNRLIFEKQ